MKQVILITGASGGFGALAARALSQAGDADANAVADAIVRVVDAPFGKRPFRVHVDPTQDGAEVVNAVKDRVRAELLRRIGLAELLTTVSLRSSGAGLLG
jgi:NAD(P)-dependent dehydrogenase (short-subunit alcohol dehydrogenase family)